MNNNGKSTWRTAQSGSVNGIREAGHSLDCVTAGDDEHVVSLSRFADTGPGKPNVFGGISGDGLQMTADWDDCAEGGGGCAGIGDRVNLQRACFALVFWDRTFTDHHREIVLQSRGFL